MKSSEAALILTGNLPSFTNHSCGILSLQGGYLISTFELIFAISLSLIGMLPGRKTNNFHKLLCAAGGERLLEAHWIQYKGTSGKYAVLLMLWQYT